jgi:DNA-binding MarR family transcriptional regulator
MYTKHLHAKGIRVTTHAEQSRMVARRSLATPSLTELPGHLIRRAHQHAVAAFTEVLAARDLTPVQFAILQALDTAGDMTLTHLVDAIALDAATCGSTLDRLEAKGWVVRVASTADRRRKHLHLTDTGRKLLAQAWPAVQRSQALIVQRLNKGEQREFVRLLRKLIGIADG